VRLKGTSRFARWLGREKGATIVEYALLAAILVVGLFAALTGLRDEIKAMFTETTNMIRCGEKVC